MPNNFASITIGQKPVYDPPPCYVSKAGRRPINYFRMRTGAANYGQGRFLMLRSDYDSIVGNGGTPASILPLTFGGAVKESAAGVTIMGVVCGCEAAITNSSGQTSTDMVEVIVQDQRCLNVIGVSQSFNVQRPGFAITGPLVAVIDKAVGKTSDNPRALFKLPQQNRAPVGSDDPPVKLAHHFPPPPTDENSTQSNYTLSRRVPFCWSSASRDKSQNYQQKGRGATPLHHKKSAEW